LLSGDTGQTSRFSGVSGQRVVGFPVTADAAATADRPAGNDRPPSPLLWPHSLAQTPDQDDLLGILPKSYLPGVGLAAVRPKPPQNMLRATKSWIVVDLTRVLIPLIISAMLGSDTVKTVSV